MSLFQLHDYWQTKLNEGDEYDFGGMAIGNADNQGGDKIIVGLLGGNLRIYEPKGNQYRGLPSPLYLHISQTHML